MDLALKCGLVFDFAIQILQCMVYCSWACAQRRQTDRQGRGGEMDDGESVMEQNRKVAMNRYPGGRRQYNYPFFSIFFPVV